MSTLSEKIKQTSQTVYQSIADKYNTTPDYVGQVARGERKGLRGKAKQVKQALEQEVTLKNYSQNDNNFKKTKNLKN